MRYSCLLLLLLAFCCTGFKNASPVGTWKRTGLIITGADGKTTDVQQALLSSTPCAASISYSFLANNTMQVSAPACDAVTRQMIEGADNGSQWSLNGNTLTVKPADKAIPAIHYTVSFTAATMTWVMVYDENGSIPNPAKAKTMTITYQRLKN